MCFSTNKVNREVGKDAGIEHHSKEIVLRRESWNESGNRAGLITDGMTKETKKSFQRNFYEEW